MLKRILLLLTCFFFAGLMLNAQTTTSSISGFVSGTNNERLVGATVTATHVPTGTVYRTQTKSSGKYDIYNMNPGGPYTITISYVNFDPVTRQDVYLTLGETSKQDFNMSAREAVLSTVVVSARGASKQGVESNISRDRVQNMPVVSRNLSDLLKAVPQAKLGTTEGSISIAGQNNRYNAFYVDGALNNDVFGLSASGTNGGQANIPPISLDAIDQINVVISPYDASLSGFTGGGINAITRSGTNTVTGSVYYLYRNEQLAGRTPTGDKAAATKLAKFENKTYGFRVGGPIIKNKLFYFLNAEIQDDKRPQPFDTSRYTGNTRPYQALALAETLRKNYGYDPGGFLDNAEKVYARRGVAKLDWTINEKHKFAVSYRYTYAERYNTTASNTTALNFFNNGYTFPNTTNTGSAELRSNFGKGMSNRLLVTYTDVEDDRRPLGADFPRVQILDGTGTGTTNGIIFGPDLSSTVNYLKQNNLNILDIFRITTGKHNFSFGPDIEHTSAYNSFIQRSFGSYIYANLDSFLQNKRPNQYRVGYSLVDPKNASEKSLNAAANFSVMRTAFFINDEFRPSPNVTLNFGIRADKFSFITTPAEDTFTNKYALPVFAQYYDLQGARSGQKPSIPIAVSPRFGLTYRIPDQGITVRFGAGIFTGRIPLVWPGGIYNNNGLYVGGFTANYSATGTAAANAAINNLMARGGFNANPYGQYSATDLGLGITKGPLNLIAKNFKLPQVFRTSVGFDKQLGKGWIATMEGFFTKNTQEIYYTNIGIQSPIGTSVGPGSRTVYPSSANVVINGSNTVYDNAILISNAKGDKGFSYNLSAGLEKRLSKGLSLSANYTYGEAMVLHEPTSSVNVSQWQFVETVNGRNNITRSYSDFSLGHRIFAYASKQFTYANKMLATTITLTYTGQSGNPFSYVYSGAVVRDDPSGGNDLLYIPTATELQSQTFLSNTVGSGASAVTYTPQQQKDALETYIQNNSYLRSHRGQFAERNGARLPFTHIVDLQVAQDFNLKIGAKRYQFQLTWNVANFTNLLNRDWGRTYFANNDNFALVTFAGYVSATNLTPQYRFNPNLAQPETFISTSSAPSFSPRWISQVGIRFNF